jgi:hypothetical protein
MTRILGTRTYRVAHAHAQIQFRKNLLARAQIGSPEARVQDLKVIQSRIDEFASYLGCLAPIRSQRCSESEKDFPVQKDKSASSRRVEPRLNPFLTRAGSDSIASPSQMGA